MSHTPQHINDLGLGDRALQESTGRILNRDGTFNVNREGRSFWQSVNPYHLLLSTSWTRFNFLLLALYLGIISMFGLAFFAIGSGAIQGTTTSTTLGRLADAFNLSVHTMTTVGFGYLRPYGTAANLLVTMEAAVGMSGIAVAAGLIFARVSAPSAKVLFSNTAIMDSASPNPAFKFRMVNSARSELVNATARVILAKTESQFGIRTRRFHELPLERDRIAFFALDWTVVHSITSASPLHGMSAKDLEQANVEFLILINAVDDGAFQTVHARSSYRCDEVTWNQRYVDMYSKHADGQLSVNLKLLLDVEPIVSRSDTGETIWET